jgi:hypothetical protein
MKLVDQPERGRSFKWYRGIGLACRRVNEFFENSESRFIESGKLDHSGTKSSASCCLLRGYADNSRNQ